MKFKEGILDYTLGKHYKLQRPNPEWEVLSIIRAHRTPNGKGINIICLTNGGEKTFPVRKSGGEKYTNVAVTNWGEYMGFMPTRLDKPKVPKSSTLEMVIPIE